MLKALNYLSYFTFHLYFDFEYKLSIKAHYKAIVQIVQVVNL